MWITPSVDNQVPFDKLESEEKTWKGGFRGPRIVLLFIWIKKTGFLSLKKVFGHIIQHPWYLHPKLRKIGLSVLSLLRKKIQGQSSEQICGLTKTILGGGETDAQGLAPLKLQKEREKVFQLRHNTPLELSRRPSSGYCEPRGKEACQRGVWEGAPEGKQRVGW